jgi:ABC-2 type transport system permease protein
MLRRIREMLIKEFLQMLRDPRMRAMIFIMPIMQMLIFAFALTTDVTHIRTAVLDLDQSPASRALQAEFTGSGYFDIVQWLEAPEDMAQVLDRGQVRCVFHFAAGFDREFRSGRTAKIQVIADATDSNSTAIVFNYASQILAGYINHTRAGGANIPGTIAIETRSWFNPNMESKYFYVPGLIAVMLLVVSVLLASIAIVREKEIGTIEQLMVTPIGKMEFILGKTVPYMILGYIIMSIMLLLSALMFGITVQGSILLLYLMAGVYLAGNLGLALFISTTAETQQQALLTGFFFLMPCVLLSGFIFPVHNMPILFQYATYLDPLRWFLDIIRGVVTKGVGIQALWKPILGQCILALLFLTLAVAWVRKTSA